MDPHPRIAIDRPLSADIVFRLSNSGYTQFGIPWLEGTHALEFSIFDWQTKAAVVDCPPSGEFNRLLLSVAKIEHSRAGGCPAIPRSWGS